jgi:hypothetical protein
MWPRLQSARNRRHSVWQREPSSPQHSLASSSAIGRADRQTQLQGGPGTPSAMATSRERLHTPVGIPEVAPAGMYRSSYDGRLLLIQSGPSQDEINQHIRYLNFCSRADNVREEGFPEVSDEDLSNLQEAYDAAKRQIRYFESRWRLEGQSWVAQLPTVAQSSNARLAKCRASSMPSRRGQSKIPVSAPRSR